MDFFSESLKRAHPNNKEVTDAKINSYIAKWFRQAPDRKLGAIERKKGSNDGNSRSDEEEEGNEGSST